MNPSKRLQNYRYNLIATYPIEIMRELEKYPGEGSVMEWTKEKNNRVNEVYSKVLPSLCKQHHDLTGTLVFFDKFKCLFESCLEDNLEFATRQSLIRHITVVHGEEITVAGAFIKHPTEFGFKAVNLNKSVKLVCIECKLEFKLESDLQLHTFLNKACQSPPKVSSPKPIRYIFEFR